ncbi:hypothetical protein D0T50_04555 [Bacteroides sp. 214]|uniref:hypothetical protein n=1 Tax=Bacteroides sp. 214 TaxID=2302935 RepID=UPI0013D28E20|nr:hypothetical protein [Bacteroides sp. 214]NDW12161.1 hypothetical protein [Bacteroides sp. 214]
MNNRKVIIAFALLVIGGVQTVFAQSKLHLELDYGYMIGISEKGDAYNIKRSEYKMYTNSLRLSAICRLSDPLSVGLGIGLERYENPGYNTLPIFATVRYSPVASLPKGYVYTDVGAGLKTGEMVAGFLWGIGVGHLWMFRKHFGLKAQVGYNLKQLRGTHWRGIYEGDEVVVDYYKASQWRHSLALSVGIIF